MSTSILYLLACPHPFSICQHALIHSLFISMSKSILYLSVCRHPFSICQHVLIHSLFVSMSSSILYLSVCRHPTCICQMSSSILCLSLCPRICQYVHIHYLFVSMSKSISINFVSMSTSIHHFPVCPCRFDSLFIIIVKEYLSLQVQKKCFNNSQIVDNYCKTCSTSNQPNGYSYLFYYHTKGFLCTQG